MLSIRKAYKTDIPLVRELALAVWPQTYSTIISADQIEYMLNLMYSHSSLEEQMQQGAEFIIVSDEETPVGFASFQETEPFVYKLHKIYILPNRQGKGTGRFVIDYILDTLKKRGAGTLQLQVNRNNTACEFYEKLGFRVIKKADFDIGGGYFMNDFVMEKAL